MPLYSLRQIFIGLAAPILAFRFLFKQKKLLVAGILPHILNFIIYLLVIKNVLIGKIIPVLADSFVKTGSHPTLLWFFQSQFFSLFIWIIALLLYSVLGTAFVNAIASPIYDIIAQRAFEDISKKTLPKQTFMDFVDSVISELTKAVVVFCLFVFSFFVPFLAPFLFIGSFWYLGWNVIDRTLLLMNMSLKDRLLFGKKHFIVCFGLGIWCYIPGLSTLFAFAMAPAGGIATARIQEWEK